MRPLYCSAIALTLGLLASPIQAQFVKYGRAGFWGGYKDKEISPGIWRVSASLNAASGGGAGAVAMANYRAAEIVKDHGFGYIRILKTKGFSLDVSGNGYSPNGYGPGYAELTARGAKDLADDGDCLAANPSRCTTLKIDEMMTRWRPFMRFK
jgi:hypothetical protein